MDEYTIEAICGNGHRQSVIYRGLPRQSVEMIAGLLDGTSPCYIYPPGDESTIGRCGICGAKFRARVLPPAEEASAAGTAPNPG